MTKKSPTVKRKRQPPRPLYRALCAHYKSVTRQYEQALKDFKVKLADDPHYALDWSITAFTTVARLTMYRQVVGRVLELPPEETTEEILADWLANMPANLRQHALTDASHPRRSTSPTSDLLAEEDTRAKIELAKALELIAKYPTIAQRVGAV